MAERNGERHLELAARPQCMALLDRASRARTAFGTVETQSERAQLDEAGAAPATSLDYSLPDGRPQSRAEDPALVAFARPRREHAHRSRQSAAGRGALEKSVELEAFAQRHFSAHQQRAAHRIGVLPHGREVGGARDLRRELALVLEPAVRPIELYRHCCGPRWPARPPHPPSRAPSRTTRRRVQRQIPARKHRSSSAPTRPRRRERRRRAARRERRGSRPPCLRTRMAAWTGRWHRRRALGAECRRAARAFDRATLRAATQTRLVPGRRSAALRRRAMWRGARRPSAPRLRTVRRPAFTGACTEWLLGRAARLQWRDRAGIRPASL